VTSSLGLLFLVLLGAAVVAWLLRRSRTGEREDTTSDTVVDRDTLAKAEEDVQDLDAFVSPEDAGDRLPDWGPGAPKS
jgi:hypothetical protein